MCHAICAPLSSLKFAPMVVAAPSRQAVAA
jgi:hypothetical protein